MAIDTYTPNTLPYINDIIKPFVTNTHFDDGHHYGLNIITLKTKQGREVKVGQNRFIKIRTLKGTIYVDLYDAETSQCLERNIRLK